MNRTGLLIALALAAATGLLFGVDPALDLALVPPFFDPAAGGFWGSYPGLPAARSRPSDLTLLVAPAPGHPGQARPAAPADADPAGRRF